MFRIALILMAIAAITLTSLYTEEIKKVIAFTKLANKSSSSNTNTQQLFYKWQDQQGQWHLSDTAPKDVIAIIVQVDPSANIIQSVKLPKDRSEEKTELIPDPSPIVPMTVNPLQIPELINQAKDVERLLQGRQQKMEKALQ